MLDIILIFSYVLWVIKVKLPGEVFQAWSCSFTTDNCNIRTQSSCYVGLHYVADWAAPENSSFKGSLVRYNLVAPLHYHF